MAQRNSEYWWTRRRRHALQGEEVQSWTCPFQNYHSGSCVKRLGRKDTRVTLADISHHLNRGPGKACSGRQCSIRYVYKLQFFNHLAVPFVGHLSCFQFFSKINSISITTGAHTSLCLSLIDLQLDREDRKKKAWVLEMTVNKTEQSTLSNLRSHLWSIPFQIHSCLARSHVWNNFKPRYGKQSNLCIW